ncbi:DUF5107 domain-containing protein [Flavobacteriaceae bacterium F89]|uniref:DUF5107 domain-containing protein n=1 Tax=Cerina litoralis TaxID=2874477 RepID=A0AAE3JPM7_9FLAO|nr:DUF5107 domain-containing protein [Cerina litoralis]MCG2462285.1 DUF5107 domain-containing protein [Cerina litoralis]
MNRSYLVFVLNLITCFASAQQNAKITETIKKYVTYPFSDPNPIPSEAKIYPYFRFDGFTDKGAVKEWKVVNLENDYISVQIMPEIGGKVWTATSKKSGKDFFYNNGVVKFRDIAMRGPWVSGGIESNYGIIGHTPNSATPVDYLVRSNADGSVSCFTSTLDLLTRTRWVIETRLEKDKAYFTTRSYWFNGTSLEQPYYTWMNAGIPAREDLQFLYPGNHYIGHDGSTHNWPIDDQGRNLSYYDQNNFEGSKSYHVLGALSNYFGGYWKNDDFGMIHYADRGDKLGKKIFLWAQSEQGKIWEDLLTDDSGQYVEIQSGRLFNQNMFQSSFTPFKQTGFEPYNNDQWTEYWYPFSGLKGFSQANRIGAFNIQNSRGKLTIKISPVQPLRDSLSVYGTDGLKITSILVKADPLETVQIDLDIPQGKIPKKLKLKGEWMELTSDKSKEYLDRPLQITDGFDFESAYGLYLQGRDQYRFRNYGQAEEKIKASLSKDSLFQPALVEMIKLELFGMEYDSAFAIARKALSIDTYDGAANYYYGLAASELSKDNDAMDGFEVASLTPQFRNAAYTAMAREYTKQSNFGKAKSYATRSLENQTDNLEALQLLHVLARIQGDSDALDMMGNKIQALNPLNHFIRFEKYYESPTEENKESFISLIRNELPIETFLELATWYSGINRLDESRTVLELSPKNTIALYWLAWLYKDADAELSKEYLVRAEDSTMEFNFPFREETATVLSWAAQQSPSWKADYLWALIENFRRNNDKALALLSKHDGETIDFAPYYVKRAKLDKDATPISKLELIEKAVQLEPKQWRYGRILAQLWSQSKNDAKAIRVLEKYYKADKTNYIVGMDLTKAYMLDDRYEKAEDLLSHLNVLPFEGATDAHTYYRQTKLMLAYKLMEKNQYNKALKKTDEAEAWPKNLGVGKPYPERINSDLENAMRASTYKKSGNEKSAQIYMDRVKDKSLDNTTLLEKIKALSFRGDQRLF